jgi:hypothetical protein
MEEEPKESEPTGLEGETGQEPPPFDPDPELVTYLERGRPNDAPEKFREALERLEGGTKPAGDSSKE